MLEIWTLWTPSYWLSGIIKAVTAVASVVTAALLVKLLPAALKLPSHEALALAHEELRKAHEALVKRVREEHASDARFGALLDTAPDAMVVAGSDGRIDFVNVRTEQLFGYARSELLGQHLEILIPERSREGHTAHLADFFSNPGARPMGTGLELYGLSKHGTELPIEVSLSPLLSGEGITVSAAIRDISERKRMEAAAKLVSDRLVSAVESIQDAFALVDDQSRLVLCNSVYRRCSAESIAGR